MRRIEHIIEPNRVWLVWQPPSTVERRLRRIVGEIVRDPSADTILLNYLNESEDFKSASLEGFAGYSAFKITTAQHTNGVLDAFMRRLPPRNREDFKEYLAQHRLSDNFDFSDLALLAYTGAKLPGDGFEFCPDLANARPPFEIIFEIAGFRHQDGARAEELSIDAKVDFVSEPDNVFDANAVAVHFNGIRIGYVSRSNTRAFHEWMRRGYVVQGSIERINGRPERPLIYLYVSVR